jgi:hypothetical protein
LVLRRDMSFWHEGQPVSHPKLYAAFLRGVRYLEEEGVFVVQLGHFRGQIEVEDTPFWVVAYDPDKGEIQLTDETCELLRADTVRADPDDVLRCTVKGRFPARFTHAGQAHLLDAVESTDAGICVRAGDSWLPVSGLEI